jgi:PilZ domain
LKPAQRTTRQRFRTSKLPNIMSLPPTIERRKFERLQLHLPLQFTFANGPVIVDCFTENISSEGVYFVSSHSLSAGDRLSIDLLLAPYNTGCTLPKLHLRCRAQVVRVDSFCQGLGFGIACRIESYDIRFGDADRRRTRIFKSAKA